jgi:hypothetical protein
MKDTKLTWDSITKARNMFLSRSNWTQLRDSGLSSECVEAWKEWRKQVRDVTKTNHTEVEAKEILRKLNDEKPREVRTDHDFIGIKYDEYSVDRELVKALVEDVLNEHGYEIMEKEDGVVEQENSVTLSEDDRIQAVRDALYGVYIAKIEEISPHPSLSVAYMERLNQAIDYLSGQGTIFPLIEEDGIDTQQEASKIVQNHGELIRCYAKVTKAYESYQRLAESGTIASREALPRKLQEELDGY